MDEYSVQFTELRKFVAPEIIFGPGAHLRAGQYTANLGIKKVLLVSDEGVIKAGWTGQVMQTLEEAGIQYCIFSELTPNPKDYEVMAGWETYQKEKCDGIIAVGGGSCIDCAKGIGIVATNHGHILEYEGIDSLKVPCPPMICIPTTAGSSADVSQFAIITDSKNKRKIAIISKALVPDASLISPETTTTLSPLQTAQTGMDALCHAIEAMVSNASSPITDLLAINAINLISTHLPKAVVDLKEMKHRNSLMLASMEAGFAFSNASLGLVHALAHALGGFSDANHGESNALLLPYVIKYNFSSAIDRYLRIGKAMGLDFTNKTQDEAGEMLVKHLEEMNQQLSMDWRLSKSGYNLSDIPQLARAAIKDPCLLTNPRPAGIGDLEEIYAEAI
jgi:alcohol dehydrogenase class IV